MKCEECENQRFGVHLCLDCMERISKEIRKKEVDKIIDQLPNVDMNKTRGERTG